MLQLALRRKRRKLACISVVYVAAMNVVFVLFSLSFSVCVVVFVSSSSAHVLSRYEVVSYAYLMFFKDDCFRGAGQRLVFPTRLQSFIVVRWLLSGQVFQDASEPLKAS